MPAYTDRPNPNFTIWCGSCGADMVKEPDHRCTPTGRVFRFVTPQVGHRKKRKRVVYTKE